VYSSQRSYKDLSERLKKRELDLAIVVNMFLTGFATTLNTLWVDKNLRAHGLIQAYSRTNRILNSVKTYSNIVSFRDLEGATNDALALFGNKDAKGIVLLKPCAEYYAEYSRRIAELTAEFPLGQPIVGEAAKKAFVNLFGAILRLKNILTAFDDFAGNEILSERDFQDYQSLYLNLYAEFRGVADAERELINDDVVFEIELIKQVEINVDYILMLVEKYLGKKSSGEDKEIRGAIARAINASPACATRKTSSSSSWIPSPRKPGSMRNGLLSLPPGRRKNWTGSSPMKGSTAMRRGRLSTMRSATAPSLSSAPPSRKSCRRSPGSAGTTIMRSRSRPYWTNWERSSSVSSA
jgi:type I site-specific restriction-modification system R (restriction) subunit